jgi:dTDP-glucose 4,6-dehydratase
VFVQADIGDREAMARVFAGHRPDAVVNLAAETHVDRSIDGPRPFIDTNIVGTFVLLDVARQFVSGACDADARERFRFLHVSTDEVYGTLGASGQFNEDTPYAPNSPYAASKASADHLVRAYGHTYGLSVLITNCSNNYGPYQFPEKLIPLMILNAIVGRPLPIYGDGGNVRDWLHVEDHCAGLLLVLDGGRAGEKYNVGGGNERTNLEIVDGLCDVLDELRPVASNPALRAMAGATSYRALKTRVPDRPGHDRRYAIDAARIRRELGWTPRHSFDAGLRQTVIWYLEHRDWCDRVQAGRYDRQRLGLSG